MVALENPLKSQPNLFFSEYSPFKTYRKLCNLKIGICRKAFRHVDNYIYFMKNASNKETHSYRPLYFMKNGTYSHRFVLVAELVLAGLEK